MNPETFPRPPEILHDTPEYNPDALHDALLLLPEGTDLSVEPNKDSEPDIIITDDSTILVDGHPLELNRSQRFIFNCLRLSKGEQQTGPELRDLGYQGTKVAFNVSMKKFLQKINGELGVDLIKVEKLIGQGKKGGSKPTHAYTLLKEVAIVDMRHTWSPRKQLLRGCLQYKNDALVTSPEGYAMFKSQAARETVAAAMLQEYRRHPDVNKELIEMLDGHIGKRSPKTGILPIKTYPELSEEQEIGLFELIDQGLFRYVSDETVHNPEIIEAVNSVFKLYLHHAHHIGYLAKYLMGPGALFEDLYQAGALRLLSTVVRHSTERRKRYGLFRHTVTANLRYAMLTERRAGLSHIVVHHKMTGELNAAMEVLQTAQETEGRVLSLEEIAKEINVSERRVMALLALAPRILSDDETYSEAMEAEREDEFDNHINQFESAEMLHDLFIDTTLSDKEKIVLSIFYGIFENALCGAEFYIRGKGVTFVYPYEQEEFDTLHRRIGSFIDLDNEFGAKPGLCSSLHTAALGKARDIIEYNPYDEV